MSRPPGVPGAVPSDAIAVPGAIAAEGGVPAPDWASLVSGAAPDALAVPTGGAATGPPRAVVLAGGPAGLRGAPLDAADPAWTLPVPSALAATWDPELAELAGHLVGRRARRTGAGAVVAPLANLQRTPADGRHADLLAEDPLLAARLVAGLVRGIQAEGVAACLAHYPIRGGAPAASWAVQVGERALREVHLVPFEAGVRAGAWAVLVAGAGVDDGVESAHAAAHHRLLGILKDEWGFDGVVLADGLAPCLPIAALAAGLDVLLPGPRAAWDADLLAAVPPGAVPAARLADAAARVRRLAVRVEASDDDGARPAPDPGAAGPGRRVRSVSAEPLADLRRRVAASAVVVLRDDASDLPRDPHRLLSVAVIGRDASTAADGLRRALPGAWVGSHPVEADRAWGRRSWPVAVPPEADVARVVRDPRTGAVGARVQVLDRSGAEIESWLAGPGWDGWIRTRHPGAASVRLTADVTLEAAGSHWVGAEALGAHRVVVDGRVVSASSDEAAPDDVLGPALRPGAGYPRGRVPLDVAGCGVAVLDRRSVRVDVLAQVVGLGVLGRFARVLLRHRPPGPGLEDQVAAAERAAEGADLVVVVVRGDPEGGNRTSFALPGRQDELVERILAGRPDAVVVVSAGAPTLLPWLNRARTVLWAWPSTPGWGDAVADVLLGRVEPAGRLPWTLPARVADIPVPQASPDPEGVVPYLEGVHVGYRSWELSGREPAAPFGHGLGWTAWEYEAVEVVVPGGDDDAADDDGADDDGAALALAVTVRNVGSRAGREVVQAYLEVAGEGDGGPTGEGIDRPRRWLAGFAAGRAGPGEAITVRVSIPERAFQVWDVAGQRWVVLPGTYRLVVGRSVRDVRLAVVVER